MAEPTAPPVEVAGLEIPADLAPSIVEAFRNLYPTVTDGKDDDAAVRAVLVWFITSALETDTFRRSEAALTDDIEKLRSETRIKQDSLREQIQHAAKRIKEKPLPPTSLPPKDPTS